MCASPQTVSLFMAALDTGFVARCRVQVFKSLTSDCLCGAWRGQSLTTNMMDDGTKIITKGQQLNRL